MADSRERSSPQGWLRHCLCEFVTELHRQRRLAEEKRPAGGGEEAPDTGFETVQRALMDLLRIHEEEAGAMPRLRGEPFRKAQYAMVALADEIFIKHMPGWEGARLWEDHPLEVEIFGGQEAADRFFVHAEEILQGTDQVDRALAEVYYYALCLGFEGMHDAKERARVQRLLLAHASPGERQTRDVDGLLTPQAYEGRHTESRAGLLPTAWRAVGVLAAVALVAVVVFTIVYFEYTREVTQKREAIGAAWDQVMQPYDSDQEPAGDAPPGGNPFGTREGE
jgi:type IV/VI secretion system ImpK/VasF family protein